MIFLLGRVGKASLILRIFAADAVAWANDLVGTLLIFSLTWNLDFFNCSEVGRGGKGRGMFLLMLL